ncbi:MAG: S8 family serine peptidase [Planctomycetes bacterium]|nr:S8 family serine peptidase [Planctomycetota bacterium]
MRRTAFVFVLAAALMIGGGAVGAAATDAPGQPGAVEFNGTVYRVEKVPTSETKLFYGEAGIFTADELRAYVAAQQPQILTVAALTAVRDHQPDAELELIVVLREQPAGPLSRAQWSAAAAERETLSEQIRAVTRKYLPAGSLPPAAERQFTALPLSSDDLQARRALAAQLDEVERAVRVLIATELAAAVQASQDALAEFVEQIGGRVVTRVSVVNALGIRITADKVDALSQHPLVARIDLNHVGYPELDNHRHSLGLETGFWAHGLNGGVHDVGVLDTGVEQSHPALSSHRFLSNMGTHDTSYHGTGMAGILASTDTVYRGMAYGCDTIVVALAGAIETSMVGMDYIAGTGEPENVNYSFGNGTANDVDYGPTDQFFDGVIDTFGFMVSKSTGNGGWGVTTITHPAPAYNLLASANMDDLNTITRDDDRITSSSSTGPTKDGRKKPDITAPGTNSMSCNTSGGFSNIGGTSSASPHTGGGIVLLCDMGTTNVMAGKAVLLNTTDAMDDHNTSGTSDDEYVDGSFWDARYGWGYLNLGAAYIHGLDVFVDDIPDAPEDADFRLFTGQMFTHERATLVWQRHVAYNGATYPTEIEDLSDLDLFAYRLDDNAELASSTSAIDNVEQIDVDADAHVVLKVEASGQFDPDVLTEQFALATQENFTAAAGPALSAAFILPPCITPGEQFTLAVDVSNTGDLPAHAVLVELSDVAIVSGPNPAEISFLGAGLTETVTWEVQAPGLEGIYPASVDVLSDSYGEEFVATEATEFKVWDCVIGDLNCDGGINGFDIDPFVLVMSNEAPYDDYYILYPDCDHRLADVNADGHIDGFDIDEFVVLLGG